MAKKIKTDVDRLLLILIIKRNFQYSLLKLNFFSILKPQVVHHFPNFKKKILCTLGTNM